MPSEKDERGLAKRGSQLQLAVYVNARPDELSRETLKALPDLEALRPTLRWTSPLATDSFDEYRDGRFLDAVDCADLKDDLKEFWPNQGPQWDALAVVELEGEPDGVLLVEAKAHPGEVYSGGTGASPASRERIKNALERTQGHLGLEPDGEKWMDAPADDPRSLYQVANRLAHLYWLRGDLGPIAAARKTWFLQVLFVGDDTYRPTTEDEWLDAIPETWAPLGLEGPPPHVGYAFLDAADRSELD